MLDHIITALGCIYIFSVIEVLYAVLCYIKYSYDKTPLLSLT